MSFKVCCPRFEDSGLGGLPVWQIGRMGEPLRFENCVRHRGKKERLGLQSLLNFKWELAIGGQSISQGGV